MTKETAEKKVIKDYLKLNGYFIYHNLAGLGVYPGISDLTIIKDGQVYQIEVKVKKGKQSDNQKKFQEEWEKHGGIYIIGDCEDVIKYLNNERDNYIT